MDAEFWEELNALRKRKLLESKPEPAELDLATAKLTGLVSTTAPILTAEDKANATESQQRGWLTRWKWSELKPQDWIARLDEGKTICTGAFIKDERGKFRHRKDLWKGTRLICTDGDKVRSVERDNDGNDKNPDGVEPFSDINKLLEIYPSLRSDGYAIGHSISSLSEVKPPPHCRTRITFLTERLIKGDEYDHFLRGLSESYPIITAGRSPAQPVFGNAQRNSTLLGNVLSNARIEYIVGLGRTAEGAKAKKRESVVSPPLPVAGDASSRQGEGSARFDGDLTKWLTKHKVNILGARQAGTAEMLFVPCPWEAQHTTAFGNKDTAVFTHTDGVWCFHCFHEHCQQRGWKEYRAKVAPKPLKRFDPHPRLGSKTRRKNDARKRGRYVDKGRYLG